MLPLSYAAIFGGCCTLIGTSTNLIVHGLVLERTDLGPMGFSTSRLWGAGGADRLHMLVPSAGCCPSASPLDHLETAREYTIEFVVGAQSPYTAKV